MARGDFLQSDTLNRQPANNAPDTTKAHNWQRTRPFGGLKEN